MGVEIIDSIDELLEKVDVVLLETNDGRCHFEQVLSVLKAGKPVFVDKPLAGSLAGAVAIFGAARRYDVPIFSSSLRYMQSAQAIRDGEMGRVVWASTYSPAPIEKTQPDVLLVRYSRRRDALYRRESWLPAGPAHSRGRYRRGRRHLGQTERQCASARCWRRREADKMNAATTKTSSLLRRRWQSSVESGVEPAYTASSSRRFQKGDHSAETLLASLFSMAAPEGVFAEIAIRMALRYASEAAPPRLED